MTDRQWALSVLGLPEDASDSDIRTAHRDLVSIWHPDQHQGNERIHKRAEEMIKKINTARDILSGGRGSADGWGYEPGDKPTADSNTAEEVDQPEESEPNEEYARSRLTHLKTFRAGAIGVLAGLAVIALFGSSMVPPSQSNGTGGSETAVQSTYERDPVPESDLKLWEEWSAISPSESVMPEENLERKQETVEEVEVDTKYGTMIVPTRGYESYTLAQKRTWLKETAKEIEDTIDAQRKTTEQPKPIGDPIPKKDSKVNSSVRSFSIGSPVEDVLAAQGLPSSSSPYRWNYKNSTVWFDDGGKVVSFDNVDNNLKVK